MSASVRLARLLELVPWLLARPGITVAEAAAHFGVSEEALINDLDMLICSGPGQAHGELVDIWYWDDGTIQVIDPQSLTRPLRLTAEEASALLVGLRQLAQVPGGHDRAVLERVTALLEEAAGSASTAGAAVAVAAETPPDPTVADAVDLAVREGRVLRIVYAGAVRDQETERDVDPVSVLSVDGRPYLSGWCRSAAAMRTFRLDLMRSATVLDEPAAPPPEATAPTIAASGLRPDGDPVVLDLAASARWVADEHPVDSVEEGPDGGVRVTLPVADDRWIVRLLLRLGDAAHVVAPPALAARVAQEARTALAAYAD